MVYIYNLIVCFKHKAIMMQYSILIETIVTACPTDKYGPDYTNPCFNCVPDKCHPVTGFCTDGCRADHDRHGPFCRLYKFFFFFFFLSYHFFLHCLENRMEPISTPYDGRHWWDSNLRTPACKSPACVSFTFFSADHFIPLQMLYLKIYFKYPFH